TRWPGLAWASERGHRRLRDPEGSNPRSSRQPRHRRLRWMRRTRSYEVDLDLSSENSSTLPMLSLNFRIATSRTSAGGPGGEHRNARPKRASPHRMEYPMRKGLPLLWLAVLPVSLTGCDRMPVEAPSGSVDRTLPTVPTAPTLARDEEARTLLDAERRGLYDALAAESGRPIEVTADRSSLSVVSIGLDWQSTEKDLTEAALQFVDRYQRLLDTRIDVSEYVPQTEDTVCGTTIAFDRFVNGLQVIGSRLTFHFDARGRLVWVTNGIAPVPGIVTAVDPSTVPGAQDLQILMGNIKAANAVRVPVLIPAPDGSGLFKGDLAAWVDESGHAYAAAVAGDTAVSRRFDAQRDGTGREGGAALKLPDPETGGASFITYRDEGDVLVAAFPAERNPLESAYRFLEEHPTLFHTGAPRCQYVPTRLDENPTLPGVYTVRFAQMHGPLPVFGADMVIQLDTMDSVSAVAARTLDDVQVLTSPVLTEDDAIDLAFGELGGTVPADWQQAVEEALASTPIAELGVLPGFLNHSTQIKGERLAWKVSLGSFTLIFDAETGERLWETSTRHAARVIKDANGAGVVDVGFYRTISVDGALVSTTPAPSTDILPGLDSIPGGLPTALEDYNLFLARNGHVGTNGRGGGDFVGNVDVNVEFSGCVTPNAFFDSFVTWNAFFCPGMASADVIGHEMTHGVIAATTGLAMADESGAINEAYADLFGDLADRTMNHLIGETTVGTQFRDMLNPNLSSPAQPTHYTGYVARCAGAVFPWDCDFGFVHTNSGIINRAHRLLADALSDEKVERLGVTVATSSLPTHATMHQVAAATRDVCERFVRRGVRTAVTAQSFTDDDCDAVTNAFKEVGLNPEYASGWSEPQLGFFGTDTVWAPDAFGSLPTTDGLCLLTNIKLEHQIPVLGTTLFADYDPATPPPASTNILGFVETTSFNFAGTVASPAGRPTPLGTPFITHQVSWTSLYGRRPTYTTPLVVEPCDPPATRTRARVSAATVARGWEAGDFGWGDDTITIGNPSPASWDGSCSLTEPGLELVDADGNPIGERGVGGPIATVTHWFLFVPVNFHATASVVSEPAGSNMSGEVAVHWDIGMTARPRWRYEFGGPEACDPR
ncbi:MAG: M4 family metallopeptidase, partial [Myxococcota bacterium]